MNTKVILAELFYGDVYVDIRDNEYIMVMEDYVVLENKISKEFYEACRKEFS